MDNEIHELTENLFEVHTYVHILYTETTTYYAYSFVTYNVCHNIGLLHYIS